MVFLVFGEPLTVLWPGLSVWVVFMAVELVGGTYTPAIQQNQSICMLVGETYIPAIQSKETECALVKVICTPAIKGNKRFVALCGRIIM